MTSIPKRNDLDARLQRLERAVRDLSRSNVIPLPGPPGPPGPIEGTTIEASVEMLAPLATFDELAVSGNANVGGTLDVGDVQATTVDAATATITTAMTAPLVTVGRVVYTDRTFVQAVLGAAYTIPAGTTAADIGLSQNVDVDSTADIYLVTVVADLQVLTGGNRTAVIKLVVDGVTQSAQALSAVLTTNTRGTSVQQWLITGVAVGVAKNFKVQANYSEPGSPTGSARINATHTTMTIVQQQ